MRWPLKNRENRSVTRAIKMHIFNTPTLVCENSENIYLTFVAFSSNMTSEMTQFTVFSRLCPPKSLIFRLFLNSEA